MTIITTTTVLSQKQKYFQFSKLTIKGKKNSKLKILANDRDHQFYSEVGRRKRIMSDYFSETAFGSESDGKKELYNLHEDELLLRKYRVRLILDAGGQYDENYTVDSAIMNNPYNGDEG